MPASKAEQVLDALKVLLETVPGATVQRNSVLPEKIPDGGLRRCEAVESGTTGVTTRSKCPLTADLPPFQRTCVTSGSDPKPTLVRAIRRRCRADRCYTPAQRT
jgi:hypothetical protein